MQQGDGDELWLEDVEGAEALAWVKAQNERTLAQLRSCDLYAPFKEQALAIVTAKDKIPYGAIAGTFVYNFWQDEQHVRGIWRRSSLAAYQQGTPDWEPLLDVDALAAAAGKPYVFSKCAGLPPTYERWLIWLSDGGSDAAAVREFDVAAKGFVDGGFELPASKSLAAWLDRDTLLLADASDGEETTASGYPMAIKRWLRGTPASLATRVFTGRKSDVWVHPVVYRDGPARHAFIEQADSFFTAAQFYYEQASQRAVALPLPRDIAVKGLFAGRVLFLNRLPLLGFTAGSLLAASLAELLAGRLECELIFTPDAQQALDDVAIGKDFVYVNILENVRSRVRRYERTAAAWRYELLPLAAGGTINLISVDADSDQLLASYEDFLTPPTLFALDGASLQKRPTQQLTARFRSDNLLVSQEHAVSSDGERIPYTLIHQRGLAKDGQRPTLLYGYGGFEIAMRPSYMSMAGRLWLERGGVYALANIRGGGEFGPRWHQAALKEHRQLAFDDFAAVAKALLAARLTSPRHLGIQGGSNGGLLVGVTMTQHPELFNAVLCQVPLLDMLRYHKLLAGASWVAEYGDPEVKAEAAWLKRYSPLHNLQAGRSYPTPFFITSTRDDRVHPGHARKMAFAMAALGLPFYYFEKLEGGHSISADLQQMAENQALCYSYLWQALG